MNTLRNDLPVCFRITGSRAHSLAIQRIINNAFAESSRDSFTTPGTLFNSKTSDDSKFTSPNSTSTNARILKDDDVPEPEPPRALSWHVFRHFSSTPFQNPLLYRFFTKLIKNLRI